MLTPTISDEDARSLAEDLNKTSFRVIVSYQVVIPTYLIY